MRQHLVIRGQVVTTVPEVLNTYRPTTARISAEQWRRLRPTVVQAVESAAFDSIHGAHCAMRVVSGFCAWAGDDGVPLDPETLFTPDRVERYIGSAPDENTRRTRANERSVLRRIGRSATTQAPWPSEPKPFQGHVHLKPPYTAEEVEGFWAAATDQATDRRTQVCTAMLVLGLGAGLKPREMLECTAEQVGFHRNSGVTAILLPDRTVPVLTRYANRLHTMARACPEGTLIGHWEQAQPRSFHRTTQGLGDSVAPSHLDGTSTSHDLDGDGTRPGHPHQRVHGHRWHGVLQVAGVRRPLRPWPLGSRRVPAQGGRAMITDCTASAETFNRAAALVAASGLAPRIQQQMTASTGRRRAQSWNAIFSVLAIAALEGGGSLHLTRAAHAAERLDSHQRERLGINQPMTYAQIESAVTDLASAMEPQVHPLTGEVSDPRVDVALPEFLTLMSGGLITDGIPCTATQSIDSTDYETHYRRRSWKHHMKPDVAPTSLPEDGFEEARAPSVNEPGFPRTGHDGRLQHSYDPDARDGYRAGKNKSRKSVFVGWDLHLTVDTPDLGGEGLPPLIRAASFAPAGSDKASAGMAAVDALLHTHPDVQNHPGRPWLRVSLGRPMGHAAAPAWPRSSHRPAHQPARDSPRPHPRHHLPRRRTVSDAACSRSACATCPRQDWA